MIIRDAKIEDAKEMSRLCFLSWKEGFKELVPVNLLDEITEDFWVEYFAVLIDKYGHVDRIKVILENDIIVGLISYGRIPSDKFEKLVEIHSLYILPEYFNKGYGSELVEYAVNDLRELGYHNLTFWVIKDDKRAEKFCEKNGFVRTGEPHMFKMMGAEFDGVCYLLNI